MRPKTPSIESCELSCATMALAGFFLGLTFGFLLDGVFWLIGLVALHLVQNPGENSSLLRTVLRTENLVELSGWSIVVIPVCCGIVAGAAGIVISHTRATARV